MKTLRSFSSRVIYFFLLLFIITVPFPYQFIPDMGKLLSPFFELFTKWIGTNIFHLPSSSIFQIISDSSGMYIHVLVLIILASGIALLFSIAKKLSTFDQQLFYWIRVLAIYYLAMQMLRYGFDKVFKQQFYLPEPNTLYTPLAYLTKDILYWSTMGTSYVYTVFLGWVEVVLAILLFFKPTRLIATIAAIGVLLNIVMINFSFDISVKIYSLFLFFLSIVLVAPYTKSLYHFFIHQNLSIPHFWQPNYDTKNKVLLYSITKALVIGLILLETLSPFFSTGNYNDDIADRPFLHGAYQIVNHEAQALGATNQIKRFFIHRRLYFITQTSDDKMQDFKMEYDLKNDQLILIDNKKQNYFLQFSYHPTDSMLSLEGQLLNDSIAWKGKQIDLSKLPSLQKGFHWTIDAYK